MSARDHEVWVDSGFDPVMVQLDPPWLVSSTSFDVHQSKLLHRIRYFTKKERKKLGMKGIRDSITSKHHHACNTVRGSVSPTISPISGLNLSTSPFIHTITRSNFLLFVTDGSDVDGKYTDRYEDMGWEMPPTNDSDVHLEHYYHYPGVTLGVHRIHGYQIKYERVLMNRSRVATCQSVMIHTIDVPKRLTNEDAVHLPVGEETVIVTCPEVDIAGRFVFVTVLFYKETSGPANFRCGCVSRMAKVQEEYRGVLHSDTSAPAAITGRRVHFAPLASARYPVAPGGKEVHLGPI